jgi:hypothetical protein
MRGISVRRCLLGGVAAAVVLATSETLAARLYWDDVQAALAERGMAANLFSPSGVAVSAAVNLLTGLVLVFLYAAARPRFGPGPRTAATVAVAMWLGGYVVALSAFFLVGLVPDRVLLLWSVIALIEMLMAAVVGAWFYREG